MSKLPLLGKVALVTGGSRGIGAAIALRLAADGADVAITNSKSPDAAQKIADQIKWAGRRSDAIQADATQPEKLAGLIAQVVEKFGRLDILVNNAGVAGTGGIDGATLDKFDGVMSVNVRAPYILSIEAAKVMTAGGRIVNIGSCLGERAMWPGHSEYSPSKFALAGMSRAMAWDLGARGITVNTVQPGPIDTDMNPADGPSAEGIRKTVPLGRYGKPEEIAAAVAFLASPEASYINGATLNVDGGANA